MNAVHFTYLARLPGERGNSVKFSEEGEGPRATRFFASRYTFYAVFFFLYYLHIFNYKIVPEMNFFAREFLFQYVNIKCILRHTHTHAQTQEVRLSFYIFEETSKIFFFEIR